MCFDAYLICMIVHAALHQLSCAHILSVPILLDCRFAKINHYCPK